jgi:hypothetical protein
MATISGRILEGSGDNLCAILPEGSFLAVRAVETNGSLSGSVLASCPSNDFSLAVAPGSYWIRLTLLADPLGQLPARWLEPASVMVEDVDVVQDLHVQEGTALAGLATLDGTPVSGVTLTVSYNAVPQITAGGASSGVDGAWQESSGRSPMILQNGLEYQITGCPGLPAPGTQSVSGFPTGPIQFPATNRVDCNFTTGDALRFTHQSNRLKLTSFPGDIGGLSDPIIFPEVGYGYSAQFPLARGEAPRAGPDAVNRQLFRGGLVLATASDQILSGTELEGYVTCSVHPCRALGVDGQARIARRSGGRRDIRWTYTDAGSQRPVGLRVTQLSFEGETGKDYVLYAFRITNGGPAAITLTPGVFLDFDVSPEFFSNVGYTELDNRLMVTTNLDDVGAHFGSLIIDGPGQPRNHFFNADLNIPETEMAAALRGEIGNPALPEPTDVRAVQGGNTVKLGRGKSTDLWVAIVAGDTRAQTLANARAAIADAKSRQRAGDTFKDNSGEPVSVRSVGNVGAQARTAAITRSGLICKTGCSPD